MILVLGDLGLDEYLDEPAPRPGGCAFNVACALAAGGARIAAAGPVGADGAFLRDLLAARGVDVAHIHVSGGASARQRIHLRADGEREFRGYSPGVLGGWRPGAALRSALRDAELVYLPVFDVTLALADEVLATRGDAPLALDLMNLVDVEARLDELVPRASVVFAGLEPERDEARIARLRSLARTTLVVVTLGARGARAFLGESEWSVAAAPVPGGRVVDTTGCGDAFAGAFLAARARGEDVPAALRAGARRGAAVAAHRGAVSA